MSQEPKSSFEGRSFAPPDNRVSTSPREMNKRFRNALAEGLTLDAVLNESRSAGASLTECILTTRRVCGCDLAEATKWVSESTAWADVAGRTEPR